MSIGFLSGNCRFWIVLTARIRFKINQEPKQTILKLEIKKRMEKKKTRIEEIICLLETIRLDKVLVIEESSIKAKRRIVALGGRECVNNQKEKSTYLKQKGKSLSIRGVVFSLEQHTRTHYTQLPLRFFSPKAHNFLVFSQALFLTLSHDFLLSLSNEEVNKKVKVYVGFKLPFFTSIAALESLTCDLGR